MRQTYRDWLNADKSQRALVICEVGTDEPHDFDNDYSVDIVNGNLILGDCTRSIDLDFGISAYSSQSIADVQKELNDRYDKVNKLRHAVDMLTKEIEDGQKRLNKLKEYRKKNPVKNKAD